MLQKEGIRSAGGSVADDDRGGRQVAPFRPGLRPGLQGENGGFRRGGDRPAAQGMRGAGETRLHAPQVGKPVTRALKNRVNPVLAYRNPHSSILPFVL